MKKILFISLLSFLAASSQNKLLNGSFESSTANFPDYWSSTRGVVSNSTSVVSDGLNSIRLYSDFPISQAGFGLFQANISQTFTVTEIGDHTFSFKYFIPESDSPQVLSLRYIFEVLSEDLVLFNTTGEFIPGFQGPDLTSGSWETVNYTINVSEFNNGATSADIKLTLDTFSTKFTEVFFDEISIKTSQALSTNDLLKNVRIVEYVKDNIIYLAEDNAVNSYLIYSLNGKKVKNEKSFSSNTIDVQGIEKGLYIIVFMRNDNIKISKKIILD